MKAAKPAPSSSAGRRHKHQQNTEQMFRFSKQHSDFCGICGGKNVQMTTRWCQWSRKKAKNLMR